MAEARKKAAREARAERSARWRLENKEWLEGIERRGMERYAKEQAEAEAGNMNMSSPTCWDVDVWTFSRLSVLLESSWL